MHSASLPLRAFINSSAVVDCIPIDLYTFVLATGETFQFSGTNIAISLGAAAFPASSYNAAGGGSFVLGPGFGRSKVTSKVGVEPSELTVDVYPATTDMIGTLTFTSAVRLGLFDGADIELDRLFVPIPFTGGSLDTSLGCIIWFMGRVAEVDIGRSKISFKVKSYMNLLAVQQMPRRIYSAACTHIFGDPMCGYDRVAGTNALGVATGNGQAAVTATTGTSQSDIVITTTLSSFFTEGTIIGLTGANTGYTRTIISLGISNVIALIKPFLFPVAIGDTFNVLPGCDHTTTTCSNVYQNIGRFGGFPYIPPPEYAV